MLRPDSDLNLDTFRRRSLVLVWMLFLPFLALTQGIVALLLISNGWPQVSMKNFGSTTGFMISGSAILVSNIPDLASVIIYFAIWKHFRTSVSSEHEEPYAGIWVGEMFDDPPDDPLPNVHETLPEHKVESVLKTLKGHLQLCLVDLAFPLIALFGSNETAIYFMYPMQIVCFYWVPFLVIKNGFKQLDSVATHVVRTILGTMPSNSIGPDSP